MTTIRCTQKLLKRMKGPDPLPGPETETQPPDGGRLGEWFANVKSLPYRGKSVVIFFNVRTYISIFVPGNGTRNMLPHLAGRISLLLSRLGVPQHLIDIEMNAMQEFRLLKTNSRSILGTMNDVGHYIDAILEDHRLPSADYINWDWLEMVLTENIYGAINKRYSDPLTYPKDLVERVFSD